MGLRSSREREPRSPAPAAVPAVARRRAGMLPVVFLAGLIPLACGGDEPESGEVVVDRGLLDDTAEVHYDELDQWPGAEELEATLRVDWPDSTRDIDLFQGGFQDPYYLARFTIDAADLDQLLAPAACRDLEPVAASAVTGAGSTAPDWWTPTDATSACSGGEATWSQQVAVLDDGSGALTVHLSLYTS